MQNHYFGGSNPPVASNSFLLSALLVLNTACGPEPTASPVSHVEWRQVADPVERPLAVFVDTPGGPVERVARDLDATTFLNDRFQPLLVPSFGAQPAGTVAFYTADGCPFGAPFTPADGPALVAAANRVIVLPAASGRRAPRAAPRACVP